MSKAKPISSEELFRAAIHGEPLDADRVLATYADPRNWVQVYDGKTSTRKYKAKACEWAFIGPARPPYELAQWALKSQG